MGRDGRRATFEIGWRPYYREAPIRADANGYHVLADGSTQAYARVESLFDNACKAVVDEELQADISGQVFKNHASTGLKYSSNASSVQLMRIVPAGFSRNSPSASTAAAICSKSGAIERIILSPASVGATFLVVRASRCTPGLSPSSSP